MTTGGGGPLSSSLVDQTRMWRGVVRLECGLLDVLPCAKVVVVFAKLFSPSFLVEVSRGVLSRDAALG